MPSVPSCLLTLLGSRKRRGLLEKKCLFQSLKFQFLFLLLALLVSFLFVSLHNILLSLQRCYHWFLSICLGHNAGNSSCLSKSITFYNLANGIFPSHCFRFWQHTVLYIFLHSKFLCCPRFLFFSPFLIFMNQKEFWKLEGTLSLSKQSSPYKCICTHTSTCVISGTCLHISILKP